MGRPNCRATSTAIAASIGVDVERFNACVDSKDAMAVVKADVEEGIKLGIQGTPTWFINGVQQVGAMSPEEIVAAVHQVERDLKEAKTKAPTPAQPTGAGKDPTASGSN